MDAITEYQKWKQQGESLRTQAKQAMESKFRDLLLEAAKIAQEYHRDFSATLKPPATITAFRYKTGANSKPKKPVERPNPVLAGLQTRRGQIQKKIEAAKTAGKPTKNLEDRLYEVEDELRLAAQ